uniref:Uncharacterized protein n=1 Tax=Tanacetum cinerariifolium TaxID=118510 RepID=A0A6L2NZ12_TANCI|nr:hypothetical protein [Tanacetum cinerariifolium]
MILENVNNNVGELVGFPAQNIGSSNIDVLDSPCLLVLIPETSKSSQHGLGYRAARCCAFESTEEIAHSTYEVGQSSRSVPKQEGAERMSAFRQPTLITWVDLEDGRVYTDILTCTPPAAPVETSPSPEWSLDSLQVSPSSLVVPLHIASLVATPTATILVDAVFRGAVKNEIILQRYRFKRLEREHERATVTFSAIWRPVLALEAWAALWHAIYDIQRENHDLRRPLDEERRERLELTDHVAWMERRQDSRRE